MSTTPWKDKIWYAFDLDRTLAHYEEWKGIEHIGHPISSMVQLVQRYIEEGKRCKIFTARVWYDFERYWFPERFKLTMEQQLEVSARWTEALKSEMLIRQWCLQHIGLELEVTCVKDPWCLEIYDDIARQVLPNTGRVVIDYLPPAWGHDSPPMGPGIVALAQQTFAPTATILQHPSVEVCPTCGGTDMTQENGLSDTPVTVCHTCAKPVTPITFGEYDAERIRKAAEQVIAHAPQVVGDDHISTLMRAVEDRTTGTARTHGLRYDEQGPEPADEQHEQQVDEAVGRVKEKIFGTEQPSENTGVGGANPRFTLGILDESFYQPDLD